jgi:hypothetical protein
METDNTRGSLTIRTTMLKSLGTPGGIKDPTSKGIETFKIINKLINF